MEYAVETFSLTKIFSDWWGRNKVYAVEDLNLQVRQNEVFGLLGPNGSGKSTTIKMLLGLLHPTRGRSLVLGGDGTDSKINARVGFLPEESYLYQYLTVRETLDFYGRLFGLSSAVRKARIEALLEMVGLTAMAHRHVGTFSKGMARRIGLAQALINDPDLLILDEPTTGLDPIGTRQIKDLLIQLAKRGKTILLCSHLLADVEDVCDRIAILYGGRIQIQGRVGDLLQQTNKTQITTNAISGQTIDKIRQILSGENADCLVTSPMERLESFFVKTVDIARRKGLATSGVVADSSTKISDFLAYKQQDQDILEELVTAPESVPAEPVTTGTPTQDQTSAQTAEAQPDKNLLSKLTQPSESIEPKPVEKPLTKQPESIEADKSAKSILDQLTGQTDPPEINENADEDHQGDISNA